MNHPDRRLEEIEAAEEAELTATVIRLCRRFLERWPARTSARLRSGSD